MAIYRNQDYNVMGTTEAERPSVANLLLARSMSRSIEFAIRAALCAGHAHVIRQLLTESALLAGLGGMFGLLFVSFGVKALINSLPGALPRVEEISLDGRVLVFALALSVLATIVFGLAPALKRFTHKYDGDPEGTRPRLDQRACRKFSSRSKSPWPWFSWSARDLCCAASLRCGA
jgi:hypothetical protein